MEPKRAYALTAGVRVFRSGDEIRFRKGVWSYTEAILRLAGQPPPLVRFFNAMCDLFVEGQEAEAEAIGREAGASAAEVSSYCQVLEALRQQQYLHDPRQGDVGRVIAALLGGNLSGLESYVGSPRPALFFSDSGYAREAARSLAGAVGLPLDLLGEESARELALADLTTRTEAVAHAESEARLGKLFDPYACVLGCVASPNLSLLRNLNRLLVHSEKPLVLGLIDGPFVSVLGMLPTETGCFECFEQRMLARLEDTVLYHRFASAAANGTAARGPELAPALHLLTSAVLAEGFLYASLRMLRLAGRIVNVYLPLLEIQVEDLLRVPYCPGCGFVAKAEMNELFTSSKRLVNEILAQAKLEG